MNTGKRKLKKVEKRTARRRPKSTKCGAPSQDGIDNKQEGERDNPEPKALDLIDQPGAKPLSGEPVIMFPKEIFVNVKRKLEHRRD